MTTKRECSERAYHRLGIWGQWDPCSRKATVERDGKWYCWQHDPERVAGDKEKRLADWQAKSAREIAKYKRIARNAKLAALVTPELAALLEWLADRATEVVLDTTAQYGANHPLTIKRGEQVDDARALAARIREARALEANGEN